MTDNKFILETDGLERPSIHDLVKQSESGDSGASRSLLRIAGRFMNAEMELPAELSFWLGSRLIAAADEPKKAGNALGIVGKAGNPYRRDRMELALYIAESLIEKDGQPTTHDGGPGRAFTRAAEFMEEVTGEKWSAGSLKKNYFALKNIKNKSP